jgi:LacI family transcriptional regulator
MPVQKQVTRKRASTASRVAERAGVSVTTVSFVLNGHARKHGIADGTAAAVREAAKQLRYVPNDLARSLRKQSTRAVGVIFPHLRNDWAHEIMDGIYEAFDPQGYVPLIVNHRGDPDREAKELQSLVERRVDGILCNPLSQNLKPYQRVLDRGVPLVFFGDTLVELPNVPFAAWNADEISLAVDHLIATGCRRIAYLGIEDTRRMAAERFGVFARSVRAAGLRLDPKHVVLAHPDAELDTLLHPVFASRQRPDGVFALFDDSAMKLVKFLSRIQLRVPRDVKIATLGNTALLGDEAYGITSVSAPVRAEGRAAAGLLVQALSVEASPSSVLVTGGELAARRSTLQI